MRKSKPIIRYENFADFDEFIQTAKKIQSEEDFKVVRREQEAVRTEQTIQSAREFLNREIPKYVWERLEKAGFITLDPLKWLGKKNLFAYFVERACDEFHIKTDSKKDVMDPRWVRNLKPFEILFGIKNLRLLIRENNRSNAYRPVGWGKIDKILQK